MHPKPTRKFRSHGQKIPPSSVTQNVSGDNNVVVGGDVHGNVIVGDNNTVNQTFIQKIYQFFAGDAETVDQRNRRIMLGHVENFWVKGILEKSLHGAALLELGIKEDPDALNYPWAIKREANKETLPAGTSMLEIFQEIGMGRSLLILGAPGSGKTIMLLELTRQLIERAREDVTEPIPVVFNLSSWTEQFTLADWLARELNNIYTIPKKVAPNWVRENKMLLLLDGLDEVRQESREKCVDAINQFRKENGLTSMAVWSRIQDYAELKTRLSFDGAIEIQPLTSNQVDEYFERYRNQLAGIKQALEKDAVLREMAENPLFLSIMTLAYQDKQITQIPVSGNMDFQRRHLFDTYIARMFKHRERARKPSFEQPDVLRSLSWLACKMIEHNQVPIFVEQMQPRWLDQKWQLISYRWVFRLVEGLFTGLTIGLIFGISFMLAGELVGLIFGLIIIPIGGLIMGLFMGLIDELRVRLVRGLSEDIQTVDVVAWRSTKMKGGLIAGLGGGMIVGLILGLIMLGVGLIEGPIGGLIGMISGLFFGLFSGLLGGFEAKQIDQIAHPGERLSLSAKNFLLVILMFGLVFMLSCGLIGGVSIGLSGKDINELIGGLFFGLLGLVGGLIFGLLFGLKYGGDTIIQHFSLRLIMNINNLLPWKLLTFLDHCVDLIFLRRVGGGYIFVHRLLMEHFAAMYPEET